MGITANVRTLKRQGWNARDLVIAAVLMIGALAATWPAWADIANIAWVDIESWHIFLVPPIAAWLVWLRRERIRLCRPRDCWIGPLIAGLGLLMSAWGWRSGIDAAWHGGAVVALVGAFLAVAGRDVLVRFAPAFLILVFLVPVPGVIRQEIAIPLQTASARVTQIVLDLGGVLTERTGNVVIVDDMPVAVAEACNGMRMVFALVLVIFAFAFSLPLRNTVRLALLLATPFVALAANVTRLAPTVLAYARLPQEQADQIHNLGGWIMLALAFVALLGAEYVLRWALIPTQRFTLAQRAA